MKYTAFGKTGKKISKLGFGAMRLPMKNKQVIETEAVELIQAAYQKGINYFDTGKWYCENQSEKTLGLAIKNLDRSTFYLSTKYPPTNPSASELRAEFESSLQKLDQQYIDFYHFWGIGWEFFTTKLDTPGGPLAEAQKLKKEGLIKHLSFSFHSKPEDLFKLVDTGQFESVLCQYNLLDRSNEKGIAYAKNKGLGVAIMGPVGGGRLGGASVTFNKMLGERKFISTPALSMKFVLSNPNVDMALSGMSNLTQLNENAAIAEETVFLSDEEKTKVEQSLAENKKLADLYCTGCDYCKPCPQEVNIPYIFSLVNYHKVYDIPEAAFSGYQELQAGVEWLEGKDASHCTSCGECEPKCPQKIPIIDNLKAAHQLLNK